MFLAGALSGCKEKIATAPDLGFLKVNPRTVEVLIPYEDFVDEVQVFGGYGSVVDLGHGVVALDFGGLNARTLVHLEDFPTTAQVPGTDGVTRTDSDLTFVGGRVLLVFDTVDATPLFPVDVELFDVREEWHAPTVTWEVAVDTAGDRRTWTQPGGGPSTLLGRATFDAFIGQQVDDDTLVDTVSIVIDAAAVAALGDPASGTTGLLLAAAEAAVFLRLLDMQLFLTTVPGTRPDTVLELPVGMVDLSFMVDPVPEAPVGWLRVGGAPSWRSVITMTIPRTVDGTADLCGTVGCQVDLTEVEVNLAELVLTTRQTESAFQPQETTRMDVRRVLNAELLPKSPLGETLVPLVRLLSPELFSGLAGTPVFLAVTELVRGILSGAAETETGPDALVVLFSVVEPHMLGFASFEGVGGAGAPVLRLLYTVANDVGLP
jgi:hypothetical protein